MLPIRDENPAPSRPWITWLLIAASVAVFSYEVVAYVEGGAPALSRILQAWAFVPSRFFRSGGSPAAWVTPLTAMFMHAGWLHLGGNMLYLWIFGDNVEGRFGPWRFALFYVTCGLVATAVQTALAPASDLPLLGASGAIAGVLGAYLLLYPRAKVVTLVFLIVYFEVTVLPASLVILVWFVLQLASSITGLGQMASGPGGVAYFAHVGGFVAGMLLALPAWWGDRRGKTRFVGWR